MVRIIFERSCGHASQIGTMGFGLCAALLRRRRIRCDSPTRRRGSGCDFHQGQSPDGTADVYGPAPQSAFAEEHPVDRAFSAAMRTMPAPDAEAEANLGRQVRFDPDLWIIETEDRAGRHFLDRVVH